MIITFPDTTDIIDNIRHAVGRNITIDTFTLSGCSACSLDPVTNTSVNSFCPVCHGQYWIQTIVPNVIEAHVTWGKADSLNWVPGGQLYDGDCTVQIKYTDANDAIIASGIYYHVDGKILLKSTVIYRGIPEINRILVNLKEEKNE